MPDPGRRLLIAHATPWALGGSERSTQLAIAGLQELGWQQVLLHAGRTEGQHTMPGAETVEAASQLRLADIAELLDGQRITVAHVHFWTDTSLARMLSALVPTVVTCHLPVCPNGARYHYRHESMCDRRVGTVCALRGYARDGCGRTADGASFSWPGMVRSLGETLLELRSLRRCAAVIAPSMWQRERLISDGLDADKVHIVAPPIEAPTVSASPSLDSSARRVLFAGRLFVFKGVRDLLEASAQMHIPHRVRIAGDGPGRGQFEQLAERLGIAEQVDFLGRLDSAELGHEMRSATVAVMPSRWGETFGMSGPEALLQGVPVVAYAQAGVDDWLQHEINGLAVAPGDIAGLAEALDRVLGDPEIRDELSHEAPRSMARFSARAHAARLDSIYRSAMR